MLLEVLVITDAVGVVLDCVGAGRFYSSLASTVERDLIRARLFILTGLVVVSEQVVVHVDYSRFWNVLLGWWRNLRQGGTRVVRRLVDRRKNLAVLIRLKHVEVLVIEEEVLLFLYDLGKVIHGFGPILTNKI